MTVYYSIYTVFHSGLFLIDSNMPCSHIYQCARSFDLSIPNRLILISDFTHNYPPKVYLPSSKPNNNVIAKYTNKATKREKYLKSILYIGDVKAVIWQQFYGMTLACFFQESKYSSLYPYTCVVAMMF